MSRRYVWGAVAAAAVVVAVLVGLSLTGGDDADGASSGTVEGAAEVTALVRGIPQSGTTLGDPGAPVEVIEYGDLACPACKLASETTVPELIERYVRPGRAKLSFRAIAFISPSSERGAFGAEAAAVQDATWPLVELLYRNQGDEADDWLTEDLLFAAAQELGLDMERFRSDYSSSAAERGLAENQDAAAEDGVEATPTFVVRSLGGERTFRGVSEIAELGEAIEALSR